MFPSYNNQNQNSGNNQQSFQEKVKIWWAQVPLFVRFIMITTITFYILSWFVGTFTKALTNLPALVIYKFQIWRLITSVFVTLSIFNVLFAFLAWIPDAMRLENSTGTMKYMCTFFMHSLIIQLLYVILSFVLSVFSNQFLVMPSSGLWPLIMAEITILCLNNPQNQLMMMFLPCLIPAKYYPWALFAFFSVLNMNLQFDILAGILYGYLFHHYLKTKIQISDEFVNKMENLPLLNKLQGIDSFVSLSKAISQSGGNAFFVGQPSSVGFGSNNNRVNNNNPNSAANQNPPRPQAPVTTPFQGKGSVLGSSGFQRDLTGSKGGNLNTQENTFNNVINVGENVQNLDELNDNPHPNINMEFKPLDGQNAKPNENTKKEPVNDKYKKFYDEV